MKKVLIYGYGNPGRQDDALGILLVERMEHWAKENGLESIDFDSNYQLNIEDAMAISEYDTVIFADASIEEIDDFVITEVKPSQKTEFTMHAMAPEFVLHLCQKLYKKFPDTYLIHLKGCEFEFYGKLTDAAEQNLSKAVELLKSIIIDTDNARKLMKDFIGKQEEKISGLP